MITMKMAAGWLPLVSFLAVCSCVNTSDAPPGNEAGKAGATAAGASGSSAGEAGKAGQAGEAGQGGAGAGGAGAGGAGAAGAGAGGAGAGGSAGASAGGKAGAGGGGAGQGGGGQGGVEFGGTAGAGFGGSFAGEGGASGAGAGGTAGAGGAGASGQGGAGGAGGGGASGAGSGGAGGHLGTSWGDPHLRTFDGLSYGFQAVGEFVLAADGELVVQVRQAAFSSKSSVAGNMAVAASVGGQRVGVYVDAAAPLRVGGAATTLAAGETKTLDGGGSITRTSGRYTIDWPSGDRLEVTEWGDHLDVKLWLGDAHAGKVAGLLGDIGGKPEDDLKPRSAKDPVALPPTFDDLQRVFGDSWRITQGESLFDYPAGKTTADYTDLSFPHSQASTQSLSSSAYQAAAAACVAAGVTDAALLDACILDVATVGGESYTSGASQQPTPVLGLSSYFASFDDDANPGPGLEWTPTKGVHTPGTAKRAATWAVGGLNNETATLSLGNLPAHKLLTLAFDLYVVGAWSGSDAKAGPSRFTVSVAPAGVVLDTTFATSQTGAAQAFPDGYPGGNHPAATGALETDSLGYGMPNNVYRIKLAVPHADASLTAKLTASGLPGAAQAFWAIDNVSVSAQ